jgi:hypothetical protein
MSGRSFGSHSQSGGPLPLFSAITTSGGASTVCSRDSCRGARSPRRRASSRSARAAQSDQINAREQSDELGLDRGRALRLRSSQCEACWPAWGPQRIALLVVGVAPDKARADVDCSDFSTQAQAQSFFRRVSSGRTLPVSEQNTRSAGLTKCSRRESRSSSRAASSMSGTDRTLPDLGSRSSPPAGRLRRT